MKFKRSKVDDVMGFVAIVVFVLLAFGLQVGASMGHGRDRDGVPARAEDQEREARLAAAASQAERARQIRVAATGP